MGLKIYLGIRGPAEDDLNRHHQSHELASTSSQWYERDKQLSEIR
jgi:hypothetical protein